MGDLWKQEHIDALIAMIGQRLGSYADFAARLNKRFGTRYSRNAAIGKAKRLGLCNPQQIGLSDFGRNKARERDRRKKQKMREARWAANPSLKDRYEQAKANRKQMLDGGASKTSKEYRRHIPRVPEMTKEQLRAMLKAAVENTAMIEVGA